MTAAGTTRSGVRDAGDDTIPVAVAAAAAAAAAGRLSQHAGVDPAAQHQPPPRQALHTLANHPSVRRTSTGSTAVAERPRDVFLEGERTMPFCDDRKPPLEVAPITLATL